MIEGKLSIASGDVKSAAAWLQTFPGSKIGLTALVTYPKWVKVESWINRLFSLTFQGNSFARGCQDDSSAPSSSGDWCSIFCSKCLPGCLAQLCRDQESYGQVMNILLCLVWCSVLFLQDWFCPAKSRAAGGSCCGQAEGCDSEAGSQLRKILLRTFVQTQCLPSDNSNIF